MFAEFKHRLGQLRGAIIGWSIGLALYGLLMASFFGTIAEIEGLDDLLAAYPPEFMAFFGDIMNIRTPMGYLDTYYFSYIPLIVGIFAVTVATGMLVGDEEKGTLDLVLAHPISRLHLFLGRLGAFVAATAIILVISWLSWAIPSGSSGLELTWLELLRPFIPLFALLMLYAAIALPLSLLLPAARLATMLGSTIVVGDFLLQGLAQINKDLQPVVDLLPLSFFQGGHAVEGIAWDWLSGLLVVAAVGFALSAWLFQRRDIRVGGESGWRLPLRRRPA